MCLQFLQLFQSPSSLSAHALSTLSSVNSVHSVPRETTGAVSRMLDENGRSICGIKGAGTQSW